GGGNRIPARVLARSPRLVAGGLEANVNLCLLPRRKARLSPADHQLGGWLPDLDAADLEQTAAAPRLRQPAPWSRLECQYARVTGRELKQTVRTPPLSYLRRE